MHTDSDLEKRTACTCRTVLAGALMLLSSALWAHDNDPQTDETSVQAAMRYCLTVGVRAAWGAQARFLGAPAVFKYVSERPLKKMFMGDAAIPSDAIYVLDEMDLNQRRQYEEIAFHGWKEADKWVQEGREQPDYEVLTAIFYQGCKESLTTKMNNLQEQ